MPIFKVPRKVESDHGAPKNQPNPRGEKDPTRFLESSSLHWRWWSIGFPSPRKNEVVHHVVDSPYIKCRWIHDIYIYQYSNVMQCDIEIWCDIFQDLFWGGVHLMYKWQFNILAFQWGSWHYFHGDIPVAATILTKWTNPMFSKHISDKYIKIHPDKSNKSRTDNVRIKHTKKKLSGCLRRCQVFIHEVLAKVGSEL